MLFFTEHKHLTTEPYHSELKASHLYTQHMENHMGSLC